MFCLITPSSLRVLLLLSLQQLRDFFLSVRGRQVMALIMYINRLLPRPFGGISEQFNPPLPSPICLGSDSPITPFFLQIYQQCGRRKRSAADKKEEGSRDIGSQKIEEEAQVADSRS